LPGFCQQAGRTDRNETHIPPSRPQVGQARLDSRAVGGGAVWELITILSATFAPSADVVTSLSTSASLAWAGALHLPFTLTMAFTTSRIGCPCFVTVTSRMNTAILSIVERWST